MRIKDPVSGLSHLAGLFLAIVGLVFLIKQTYTEIDKMVVIIIYGASLILLYTASSVYHLMDTAPRTTKILRKIDHVSIFLLIAGCYTPVFYLGLEGTWRLGMLIAVWSIALAGIILKIAWITVPRAISTILYVALGWIALVPFYQLIQNIPLEAILLMVLGGVFYTVGAVIYAKKSWDFFPGVFGFHEVFHFWVLAGSITHYILMYKYIIVL